MYSFLRIYAAVLIIIAAVALAVGILSVIGTTDTQGWWIVFGALGSIAPAGILWVLIDIAGALAPRAEAAEASSASLANGTWLRHEKSSEAGDENGDRALAARMQG